MNTKAVCLVALVIAAGAAGLPRVTLAQSGNKILEQIERRTADPKRSLDAKLHDMSGALDKAIAKLDSMAAKKESTWNPLVADRESIRNEINKILKDAIDILASSKLNDLKDGADQLQADIRKQQKNIADYQIKRAGAPNEMSWQEMMKAKVSGAKTKAEYTALIKSANENIATDKQLLTEIAERMQKEFEEQGVRLSTEQLNGLLYSVTGDDDLRVFSSIETVKAITVKLRSDVQDQGENIEVAKRYFGLHTVLLRAIIAVQEDYVKRIDGEFKPRLAKLKKQNDELLKTSAERQKDETLSADQRQIYVDDDKANQLTAQVIELYGKHLDGNKRKLLASLAPLKQQYLAAEHRYLTVRNSAELLALMNQANANFDKLMELSAPPLLTFENAEMESRFRDLSTELAKR